MVLLHTEIDGADRRGDRGRIPLLKSSPPRACRCQKTSWPSTNSTLFCGLSFCARGAGSIAPCVSCANNGGFLLVLRECSDTGQFGGKGLMLRLNRTEWRSATILIRCGALTILPACARDSFSPCPSTRWETEQSASVGQTRRAASATRDASTPSLGMSQNCQSLASRTRPPHHAPDERHLARVLALLDEDMPHNPSPRDHSLRTSF